MESMKKHWYAYDDGGMLSPWQSGVDLYDSRIQTRSTINEFIESLMRRYTPEEIIVVSDFEVITLYRSGCWEKWKYMFLNDQS